MKKSVDWKGNASLLVGVLGIVASIVAPFWLWKADLQAKSISVRVLSVTEIQRAGSGLDNVRVTLDGQAVEGAVISTLQVSNDGAKPIPASDFESPIRIDVLNNVRVVRAQISESTPRNLPASIDSDVNFISIRPLLLNPGDSIKIFLITANGIPGFRASGRIAGVQRIGLDFALPKRMNVAAQVVLLLLAVAGMAAYIGSAYVLAKGRWANSDTLRLLSMLSGASLFVLATRAVQQVHGLLWVPPTWLLVTVSILLIPATYIFWRQVLAHRRRLGPSAAHLSRRA